MISRILLESFRQAVGQLYGNRLRSILSLLGISIGIFCIISVKSAVDSLEMDIRDSFTELGDDVIYITKNSWEEDPRQNYWKSMRRPDPNFSDYRALKAKLKNSQDISMIYILGSRTLKFNNNSVENALLCGITEEYGRMFDLKLEAGRYFSPFEYQNGSNKAIIGSVAAEELFGAIDPIGNEVKMMGRKFQIIGIIERKGESLINIINFDEALLISVPSARKIYNLGDNSPFGSNLAVKAAEGVSLEDIKDEVEFQLRNHRRLKPVEDNNFSLNELTMLSNLLDGFFSVLNAAGFLIGIFALFVGMFSVANIMFVSVKERTSIIGIKKALGAKSAVILLEFLVESVILCVIGGIIGLAFVFGTMALISAFIDFKLFLSMNNILIGLVTSIIIGVLSGILPAISAAKMDPVEAMRK